MGGQRGWEGWAGLGGAVSGDPWGARGRSSASFPSNRGDRVTHLVSVRGDWTWGNANRHKLPPLRACGLFFPSPRPGPPTASSQEPWWSPQLPPKHLQPIGPRPLLRPLLCPPRCDLPSHAALPVPSHVPSPPPGGPSLPQAQMPSSMALLTFLPPALPAEASPSLSALRTSHVALC